MGPLIFDSAEAGNTIPRDESEASHHLMQIVSTIVTMADPTVETVVGKLKEWQTRLRKTYPFASQSQFEKIMQRRQGIFWAYDWIVNSTAVFSFFIALSLDCPIKNAFAIFSLPFLLRYWFAWSTTDQPTWAQRSFKRDAAIYTLFTAAFTNIGLWLALIPPFSITVIMVITVNTAIFVFCIYLPQRLQKWWLARMYRNRQTYLNLWDKPIPDLISAGFGKEASEVIIQKLIA